MKKKIKIFLLVLIGALAVIQFFHPQKNLNAEPSAIANDMATVFQVPDSVKSILQTSCYDCHSNNTQYPWYASIQPVAWWLNDHIEEGKKELNFNEFATFSARRQYKKLKEIIEQLNEDEMPLLSYTLIHTNAKLSAEQKKLVTDWATAARETIKSKYPADSLVKK